MHKIWLIIKREYLTRVRKKTFIISTLLFPLLYLALIFGMGYIAEKSRQNLTVAVIDSSGYFSKDLVDRQNKIDNSSTLTLVKENTTAVIADHQKEGYDGYIVIPPVSWQTGTKGLIFKASKSYGSSTTAPIEMKLNRIWDEIKNDSLQIDVSKQQILSASHLGLTARKIKDEKANVKTAEGIGYGRVFLN